MKTTFTLLNNLKNCTLILLFLAVIGCTEKPKNQTKVNKNTAEESAKNAYDGFTPIAPGLTIEELIEKPDLEKFHSSNQFTPSNNLGGGGSRGWKRKNEHPKNEHKKINWLMHWNHVAIDASGIDHIPNDPGQISTFAFGEQLGPTRAARAMAIVHIAIFEVVNSIMGGFDSYLGIERVQEPTSLQIAIAQAAHDTLAELFPSQLESFDEELQNDLNEIADGPAKDNGINLGKLVAKTILDLRKNDGSDHDEPIVGIDFVTSDDPGKWRVDPISNILVALGANWHLVKPFVMTSANQFRAPEPPNLNTTEYTEAYEEAKLLGGDGVITNTDRTPDQTETGIYWAYDGTPSLCAPPRLYNQIVVQIAQQMETEFIDFARLLALINVAMADAAIAIWESKYFYQFWRPVTGIRESDEGTGPSLIGDGNPNTIGDVTFSPLGAPSSNIDLVNFTPPFPSYPSGHAGFGGAVFQILRKFYGTDNISFTFVSDELNGITKDNQGNIRPLKPRTFSSLSEAEEENGQSRIYLGIHWSFDKIEGIIQGRHVADIVFDRLFLPSDF